MNIVFSCVLLSAREGYVMDYEARICLRNIHHKLVLRFASVCSCTSYNYSSLWRQLFTVYWLGGAYIRHSGIMYECLEGQVQKTE